ncbi:thiol peroxidase [Photobacterium chitinilyticum]|uniref:Thiol peroxidase n=2 Tax=Photobacterium chitinilyticum TaxID=2485123 RepID=A0A444JT98_9GAMM|nr:thiol peroxidase [Photobacterium chitinilyticum]RWX56283.1 thiol peroxidase [Photobacterium chitinilyticum]
MSTVLYRNESIDTSGKLPFVGDSAPFFTLVDKDITDLSLADLKGKNIILNIFLSVHIPECAQSIRDFNLIASKNSNIVFLCISADLPLAMREFCEREGLDYIKTASFFHNKSFTEHYGVAIDSGIFRGLSTPAVLSINNFGKISYSQRVTNIDMFSSFHDAIHSLNI